MVLIWRDPAYMVKICPTDNPMTVLYPFARAPLPVKLPRRKERKETAISSCILSKIVNIWKDFIDTVWNDHTE